MCRCIGLVVILVALASPLLLEFGRQNRVSKGSLPILVNEWRYKSFEDLPDLNGKVILVTGANVGLGKGAVLHMAKKDATVVMACRSEKKCAAAAEDIKAAYGKAKLVPMVVDLSSLKSVKAFCEAFLAKFDRLDSLMLNAGIMHPPFTLTEDGLESQFAVNHLAHFYMTKLLLPLVKASAPATIVSVSSNGHFGTYSEGVKLNVESLNDEGSYNSIAAYGQSKLCNVLFAQELHKRLRQDGVDNVFVNSLNPGGVNTELLRHYPEFFSKAAKGLMESFPDKIFFEPETAALTQVYLAVAPDVFEKKMSGKYYVPVGEECDTSEFGKDMKLQKGLWEFSEKLLKDKGFA